MQVNTQSVNFNPDASLLSFLQNRVNKLELYYDKVISSEVYMKVQKMRGKENKFVEIILNVSKDKLVVKKQCKSFEEAIDSACNSMGRKLIKRKEKLRLLA